MHAGLLCHVREFPVPVIVVENVRLSLQTSWPAEARNSAVVTNRGLSIEMQHAPGIDIAGDVKVQPAIAVIVAERGTRMPRDLAAQAGLPAD